MIDIMFIGQNVGISGFRSRMKHIYQHFLRWESGRSNVRTNCMLVEKCMVPSRDSRQLRAETGHTGSVTLHKFRIILEQSRRTLSLILDYLDRTLKCTFIEFEPGLFHPELYSCYVQIKTAKTMDLWTCQEVPLMK